MDIPTPLKINISFFIYLNLTIPGFGASSVENFFFLVHGVEKRRSITANTIILNTTLLTTKLESEK